MNHPGVICSKCNKNIEGFRYKCIECDHFDFCKSCKFDYHSGHILIRFTDRMTENDKNFLDRIETRRPRDKPFLIQGFHDEERCSVCGRGYIDGFLYKCCDCEFNACQRCEKMNNRCVTGKLHLLFRFADPLSLNSFNKRFWREILEIRVYVRNCIVFQGVNSALTYESVLPHEGTRCGICKNDVVGLRFRCVDCEDFYLCSSCEPQIVHEGHLVVRINKALDSQIDLFFRNIVQIRSKKKSHVLFGAQRDQNSWARNNCDIMCGNCNSMIYGFQYKCLECDDYDLCSFCQKKECHGDHMMIRFTQTFNQNHMNKRLFEMIMKSNRRMGLIPRQGLSRALSSPNVMIDSNDYAININPFMSFIDENTKEKEIERCVLCCTMSSDLLLLDCGHLCICSKCIGSYLSWSQQCPVCRHPIRSSRSCY